MEAPDEQLMTAYRDGDAGAFERLYRRHKGALFRFVLRGVSERPVAEELFQEIWMRVIEARERYVPEARFTTWLYTIAHHRLVDHWGRGAPALVALDEDPPGNPSQGPGRKAKGRESAGRFLAALEALPAAQREAFLLHEEGGLTVAAIARATGSNEEDRKSG